MIREIETIELLKGTLNVCIICVRSIGKSAIQTFKKVEYLFIACRHRSAVRVELYVEQADSLSTTSGVISFIHPLPPLR